MRPIKMNKIGMLAAAMYEILETKRNHSLVAFSVLVDTTQTGSASASDEYIVFGEVISGHIQLDGQGTIREFKVYLNTAGDLVIKITGSKKYYVDNKISVNLSGEVEINFKDRSITETVTEEWKHDTIKSLAWDWQSVKGTAADIIGTILAEKNS